MLSEVLVSITADLLMAGFIILSTWLLTQLRNILNREFQKKVKEEINI